ncbi:MAG: hypothetical protein H6625_08110 [Bdellovibrionaceae bacterium]|nr:hypothetical protein [Pseudobdellovibrionaceae bacterium]
MLKIEKLSYLLEQEFPVSSAENKERDKLIDNLLSQMSEINLYEEILILKKNKYPLLDFFKVLLNFSILTFGIITREDEDEDEENVKTKVFPSWKVFLVFMNEVNAFYSKDIPIEEWQDLGEEAIDILIEILSKNISDIYNYSRFEDFDQRWSERFHYLLDVKGYKRLLEFGPEY